MKRRLFTILSALSLLFVAVCVPWVRSYWGTDYVADAKLVHSGPEPILSRSHRVSWTRGTIRSARTNTRTSFRM